VEYQNGPSFNYSLNATYVSYKTRGIVSPNLGSKSHRWYLRCTYKSQLQQIRMEYCLLSGFVPLVSYAKLFILHRITFQPVKIEPRPSGRRIGLSIFESQNYWFGYSVNISELEQINAYDSYEDKISFRWEWAVQEVYDIYNPPVWRNQKNNTKLKAYYQVGRNHSLTLKIPKFTYASKELASEELVTPYHQWYLRLKKLNRSQTLRFDHCLRHGVIPVTAYARLIIFNPNTTKPVHIKPDPGPRSPWPVTFYSENYCYGYSYYLTYLKKIGAYNETNDYIEFSWQWEVEETKEKNRTIQPFPSNEYW